MPDSLKKIAALSAFLAGINCAQAQPLRPDVIVSSGDFFSSASGSLAWSLGEIMTETYQQPGGFLTQGFHQPISILATGLPEEDTFSYYPNPVRDVLHVRFNTQGAYVIELYDLQGVKLSHQEAIVDQSGTTHTLSLAGLASAVYILRVADSGTQKNNTYRVEKL